MPVVSVPALALTDKGTAPRTPEPRAPTSLAPPSSAGIRAEVHGLSHYGLPSLPLYRRKVHAPASGSPQQQLPTGACQAKQGANKRHAGNSAVNMGLLGCNLTVRSGAAHVHRLKKIRYNVLGHLHADFGCSGLRSACVHSWRCTRLLFVSLRPVELVRPSIRNLFCPTESDIIISVAACADVMIKLQNCPYSVHTMQLPANLQAHPDHPCLIPGCSRC